MQEVPLYVEEVFETREMVTLGKRKMEMWVDGEHQQIQDSNVGLMQKKKEMKIIRNEKETWH